MVKMGALLLLGLATINVALAERHVHVTGAFESGEVKPKHLLTDGFFIKTLPHPQGTTDQVTIGGGGAGPNSGLDTRVVPLEIVGSETVLPRSGKYFIRSAVYFNKDYSRFSGNSYKNKPRSLINLSDPNHHFDFDVEGYLGFSIFVPKNFEHETGTKGDQGTSMLLSTNASTDSTLMQLEVFVPKGETKAHWYLFYQVDPGSTSERPETKKVWVDLGLVDPDKGKWTDFVIRYRANPFSTLTNPADKGIRGAKDQAYRANKGILQLWKAEGSADSLGNRKMALKVDKVSAPIGLVPHATNKFKHAFRIYKFGWHLNPTTVKGPVWFGFDEIRYGLVGRDGTSYTDVHPVSLACSDGCGGTTEEDTEDTAPKPPKDLQVVSTE